MTIWTKSDNATAIWAAISLQRETGEEAIEKSLNKSMTPNFKVVASGTFFGTLPFIITALFKNILENNCNKDYHIFYIVWGGLFAHLVWGGEFCENFPPIFLHKKSLPKETNKFAKYNQIVNLF